MPGTLYLAALTGSPDCLNVAISAAAAIAFISAIRSEEFVPIVAVGIVEQFAQCLRRNGLRLVHARERMTARLTNG
jgi:hypothetical protein